MSRGSAGLFVAIAFVAMASPSSGLSATPATYTAGQVQAAFSHYGVPLSIAPRRTFPADDGLSVLFVARSDRLQIRMKVAVYQAASTARAAYRWVRQNGGRAELLGNLLITTGFGSARQARDVSEAIYSLSCPDFWVAACASTS